MRASLRHREDVARGSRRLLASRTIAVPALKDRREDIPALVDHFVRKHARQLGKPVEGVSPESMRRLEGYAWPGNIRELHTVLERAILVARGPCSRSTKSRWTIDCLSAATG